MRVIDTALAAELGLKKCEAGDLDSLPAADELAKALSAVFVCYKEWNLEDVRSGSPQASAPGVEVEYLFEVVLLRLQGKDEDSQAEPSDGLRKIARLFLNGHRKLPGLQ